MVRHVRRRDLVQLWARAAGMCSHPDCRKRLVLDAPGTDRLSSIGEAAHIVARLPGGPRGDTSIPTEDLDAYPNLILLCSNHHAMVDGVPDFYPVDTLRTWKAEHEAWVEAVTANATTRVPWTAIVQEEASWICRPDLAAAVAHCGRIEKTIPLRNDPRAEGWAVTAAREWREANTAIADTPLQRRRFAVFSFGRIPLAVQLGYALGDRARVALFHYDRDRESWSWPDSPPPDPAPGPISWSLSESPDGPRGEAAIRVSLSANVVAEPELRCAFEIDIRVPDPSVRWLRVPDQLIELSRAYGDVLAALRARSCRRIHLYYAGPAAGAVAFGRAYNPRMNPPLAVYDYRRDRRPSYEQALVINQ